MEKNSKIQSHNLTQDQMQELKYAQSMGTQEMVDANKNSEYKIPAVEQHLVHAVIEAEEYDSKTGKKLSVPLKQVFYKDEFKRIEETGGFSGYTVTVIHEPVSGAAKKATAKSEASSGTEPVTLADQIKVVSKMTKAQLTDKYKSIFGVEVPEALKTNSDIVGAIVDRLEITSLLEEYRKIYGEDPDADISKEELIEAIDAKKGE